MEMKLREWSARDAADVAACANNKKIADNLRDAFPHPYTLLDAQAFIDGCREAEEGGRALLRAIDIDGRAAGSVGVFLQDDVYRKSAELGYWLAEPFWGRGLMGRAVREICAQAFERFDIVRIFAEPFAGNTASRRVLEKAGFSLEGVLRRSVCKNGEILDSCMYALLK